MSVDIQSIVDDAREYATSLLESAVDMVGEAQSIASGRANVVPREISWDAGLQEDDSFVTDLAPDGFTDQFEKPDGESIAAVELLEPYIPNTPDLPEAPQALNTRDLFKAPRPDWNIADFTDAAPNLNTNLSMPTAPTITMPADPIESGDWLTVPDVVVPTFDDQVDVIAPDTVDAGAIVRDEFESMRVELGQAADDYATAWLNRHCPGYQDGMAALEQRISKGLEGGEAADEAWEEALYNRGVLRVTTEQNVNQQALTTEYARRGFTIPPGAVMAGLSRIRNEGARNLADLSAQVIVERTRIEIQHLQFVIQISSTLRQHFSGAMQNYMQLMFTANGQALQYAGEIGRWAAEVFNQRIQLFQLELERYRLESQVYAVRLESAFAEIRRFEAEVEAERLKIDVDQNRIALFEAKLSAEQTKVEIYNSQLQAVRTTLEAEAQKIGIFETQVRAYAARVGAKESEYNAYRAAIAGDSARVDAYQAEVRAYGERVQASTAFVSAERSISQSIAEYNRSLMDQRDSEIRKYVAEIQGESSRFGSSVDAYRAGLAKYSAEVEARLRMVSNRYDNDRLALEAAIAKTEQNLRGQITNVESFIKSIESQARVINSGADIISGMASSALTANNAIITQSQEV